MDLTLVADCARTEELSELKQSEQKIVERSQEVQHEVQRVLESMDEDLKLHVETQQWEGRALRLHHNDQLMHYLAQQMLWDPAERSRRGILGVDRRGTAVEERVAVQDLFTQLLRESKIPGDGWVCRCCGYISSSRDKACRGYLSLLRKRWGKYRLKHLPNGILRGCRHAKFS